MELPTWLWVLIALLFGVVFGSLSWRLKKQTRANMDLLEAMKTDENATAASTHTPYHDDYHTTESVMERAVIEDGLPLDAIEN